MRISMSAARLAAVAGVLLGSAQAHAATVFSDNFNDNDVSDWTLTTNYAGTAGIDAGGVLGPYINAPPGSNSHIFAQASKTMLLTGGDYMLSFDAFSPTCSGCTISYVVTLNGVAEYSHASNGVWDIGRNVNLGPLTTGMYTLGFAMETTNAIAGHFVADFDNVVLDRQEYAAPGGAVPEPSAWALMILGFGLAGASLRRRAVTA